MNNVIYTIGYSSFSMEKFIDILKRYKITALVDVRSQPYSRFKPEFNFDNLKKELHKHNIAYVFLGEECGARVNDSTCYVNGKVNYDLVARTKRFKKGLARIKKGMKQYTIVLMCAEKDPIDCHRTILISRHLQLLGILIKHILSDGTLEDHMMTEKRLLKLFKLDSPNLFFSKDQLLNNAYSLQGEKIAYEVAHQFNNKLVG